MESPSNRRQAAKIIMSIASYGLMRENAEETPCSCIITAPELVTSVSICLAWTMEKLRHAEIQALGLAGMCLSPKRHAERLAAIARMMPERTNLIKYAMMKQKHAAKACLQRRSATPRVDGEIGCLKIARSFANIVSLVIREESSRTILITKISLKHQQPRCGQQQPHLLAALHTFLIVPTIPFTIANMKLRGEDAEFGCSTCSVTALGAAATAAIRVFVPTMQTFTANVLSTKKLKDVTLNGCKFAAQKPATLAGEEKPDSGTSKITLSHELGSE